jgi:hypothetical protein
MQAVLRMITVQKKNIFGGRDPHFEWGSFVQLATVTQIFFKPFSCKEGGLYYMGGTYIFFLHPKWSKLCTAPFMDPKNPPF